MNITTPPTPAKQNNVNTAELEKFAALAPRWWDPQGSCKPLHDINPLRLGFINDQVHLPGRRVLDVGCGGGILSESLARCGAEVTALDAAEQTIAVAKLHALEQGLAIDYRQTTLENFCATAHPLFDVITCMELLEHVPDPEAIIAHSARVLKPGGALFLSTINRTVKSFLGAIVAAEYVLRLLPRGTHEYRQFIRPSELARCLRKHGFTVNALRGIRYNPLWRRYDLSDDVHINYLLHATYTAAESP